MRRFEFVDGSSSKFWEIELEGSGFTVRWGRIGTAGQVQQKSFATEAKATAEHDKLIAEKTKKGYVETGASASPAPAESPAAAPAPKKPAKKDSGSKDSGSEATKADAAPAPAAPVAEAPSAPTPGPSPKVIPAAAVAPHVDEAASEPVPDPRPILWTDELFRRVYARRGGLNVPVRPPSSPKKAWAPIRERVARYVSPGRPLAKKLDPALLAAERGAFARLGADEFALGSVEEDAALLAFAQH
ncbi:MAG TPA: WGR domain-containing protein, partial [Longimicrobium sp.]|nr:WGR domain-containing protein [Longimicrobium sp.]